MKTVLHYDAVIHGDNLHHVFNWEKYENDPRTKDVVLHLGPSVKFERIDSTKINVQYFRETPNSWYTHKSHRSMLESCEKVFDYILTHCSQEAVERGYTDVGWIWDNDNILKKLGIHNIDEIEKDIDVFMCGHENPYVSSWYDVMSRYNHVFACWWSRRRKSGLRRGWKDKQMCSMRSKISIVWSTMFIFEEHLKKEVDRHCPWIKYKGVDIPAHKPRVCDAAGSKSIILCYKDPFVYEEYPHQSPIMRYFEEDTDFIFFTTPEDLKMKIDDILENYNSEKYQIMKENAYNKMHVSYNMEEFYENHIVPLATKGKTK